MKRFLEVFSGENRSCQTWAEQQGMIYHSADIRSFEDYIPIYHGDVRHMNIPFEDYDIVWMSPSCVTWGRMAMTLKCRNPETLEPISPLAIEDTAVLDWLILQLDRMKLWIIENPEGWMKRYLTNKVPIYTNRSLFIVKATYCMYGSEMKKPTNFFSNIDLQPCLQCHTRKGVNTCGKVHRTIGRGRNRPTLKETHMVPESLVKQLLDNFIGHLD